MEEVYFLHQIKHTSNNWEKGIVVKYEGTSKENYDAAKQGYHAYLGAYAYGNNPSTDYVQCDITDTRGNRLFHEVWDGRPVPEPTPEPTPEPETEG